MKISACIITYNQAPFIRKCIEGALLQKTSFDYEIIIGDDNSTDGTFEICKWYADEFPDLIKLIRRPINVGMVGNWLKTISECSGDYIAICEGDDFWIDENKLHQQADFLKTNPVYNISVHDVFYVNEYNQISTSRFTEPRLLDSSKTKYSLVDYIQNECLFHTSSFMIKKSMMSSFPNFLDKVMSLDQAIFVLYCLDGFIHYINRPMSCYRIHAAGITKSKSHKSLLKSTNNQLLLFQNLDKYTDHKFHDLFARRIWKLNINRLKLFSGLHYVKQLLFKDNA